jgi:hypothetical protein
MGLRRRTKTGDQQQRVRHRRCLTTQKNPNNVGGFDEFDESFIA